MDYVKMIITNIQIADAMRTNCGCQEITNDPFEFEIKDELVYFYSDYNLLPDIKNNDLDKLQKRIICDFTKVIRQLECGIQPDIEIILEEISLIYMNNYNYYGVVRKATEDNDDDDEVLDEGVTSDFLYNLLSQYVSKSEMSDMQLYPSEFQMFSGDYTIEQLKNIIKTKQYLKNLTISRQDFDIEFNQNDYLYIIKNSSDNKSIRADLNGFEIPFEISNIYYNKQNYIVYKSINRYNIGIYNIDING